MNNCTYWLKWLLDWMWLTSTPGIKRWGCFFFLLLLIVFAFCLVEAPLSQHCRQQNMHEFPHTRQQQQMHMMMTRMNPETIPTMVGMLKVRKSRFQAAFMPPSSVTAWLKCIKFTIIIWFDTWCIIRNYITQIQYFECV